MKYHPACLRMFVLVELHEQLRVAAEGGGHERERGIHARSVAAERACELAEDPRSTEASAADHNAVTPRLLDHTHGVGRAPDVTVAEHGDARHVLLELGDGGPVGCSRVGLFEAPRVQRDARGADVLRDPAGLEEGRMVGIDAGAHLDGDGHITCPVDRGRDDVAEQVALPGQGGSAALARDLRDRASEVEVDVIGVVLPRDDPRGLARVSGVDAIQLDRAWGL